MSQGTEGKSAQGSTFGLPTEGHEELVSRLSQVENFVEDVLGCTKGAAAAAASSAVDTAVRRAKTKSKMMPVMGSGHVLAALDVRLYLVYQTFIHSKPLLDLYFWQFIFFCRYFFPTQTA